MFPPAGRLTPMWLALNPLGKSAGLTVSTFRNLSDNVPLPQLGDAFDAAHTRQVDVHQDHVRVLGRNLTQSLLAIGMSADTAQPRRPPEQLPQALARPPAVFDSRGFRRSAGSGARFASDSRNARLALFFSPPTTSLPSRGHSKTCR